jgi:ABC-type glutathione transport system ATPase component
VLQVRDLQAHFRTRYFGVHREVRAVDGVDFDVRRNEIYGLAGESSSGKTTLVKTIAGSAEAAAGDGRRLGPLLLPAGRGTRSGARRPTWSAASAGGTCPTSCRAR